MRPVVVVNPDVAGVHIRYDAVALRENHDFRVNANLMFHARPDNRRVGTQQRHGLSLHIGAH